MAYSSALTLLLGLQNKSRKKNFVPRLVRRWRWSRKSRNRWKKAEKSNDGPGEQSTSEVVQQKPALLEGVEVEVYDDTAESHVEEKMGTSGHKEAVSAVEKDAQFKIEITTDAEEFDAHFELDKAFDTMA